jgi:hypothetical protein
MNQLSYFWKSLGIFYEFQLLSSPSLSYPLGTVYVAGAMAQQNHLHEFHSLSKHLDRRSKRPELKGW